MSTASVHIVLSDDGWILEKLAKKIADNIPGVTYDCDVDASADIQYYMTYGTWRYRVSKREIGYFAHMEKDPATQEKFFNVARAVDYSVCHSRLYETQMREAGIENVVTISPGVDLELFRPRVKIGVVGRTYHTGRKGEALVAQVMDLEGIDWYFTGSGWPGPAMNLLDEQMPEFYRSMDYILVPSLYEGGPMSVVEALACGCEIIAPPIGWVPDYPHIEYRTGDVSDLRRALSEAVAKKMALRHSVLERGWDSWVSGHDKLFKQLAASIEGSDHVARVKPVLTVRKPALIVHGTEKGVDKGGPSVRAPRTALRLGRYGYEATLLDSLAFDQREHDLYHIYNLWHPRTCRQTLEHVRLSSAPVVLSPIYLDLSEKLAYDRDIPKFFNGTYDRKAINAEYARLRAIKARRVQNGASAAEPYPGFFDDVRNLTERADHLICLSEHEKRHLAGIGVDVSKSTVIRNPVESGLYGRAEPELFQNTYGVKDYVLCVGRLEARKNQLTLIHALRDSQIPLVLIGHGTNPGYEKLLRSVAGPNVTFIGRLPSNSAMLASAYAGARVFCLPSWSEGAPLVALEAAAAGCNMVLSDRSSEQEYFGDRSRYCDPGNPEQMLEVIQAAYDNPLAPEQRDELAAWTSRQFGWDQHIEKTSEVYEAVAALKTASLRHVKKAPKYYIDLTSSAHRSGPPSGIARVEERYAIELYDLLPGHVEYVLWNSHRRAFVSVTRDRFMRGEHKKLSSVEAPNYLFNDNDLSPAGRVNFEAGGILLVLGGAWIRNPNYVRSLSATKRLKDLTLVSFVHDVIQAKFKHWFPDMVGDEFADNCRRLVDASEHLIVNSLCTERDLREFCAAENLICPPIDVVRFGDEIEKGTAELEEEAQFDRVLPLLNGRPFVLCVSAIDVRKNHVMLHNIWERMLEEHGDNIPHIVMVGSKGWNIDHFLSQVEKQPATKKVFHILNGINDATLSWLYRNCLFTVYPSLYEGWGLPVAEALNYGKICIAARAGSVPEIAADHTDLLDPLDFVGWYKRITGYAFNAALRNAREEVVQTYQPVSWKQSAVWLNDLLSNIGASHRPSPEFPVGKPVPFDKAGSELTQSRRHQLTGWYEPETRGTWTAGHKAILQGQLSYKSGEPLLAELVGYAFTYPEAPKQTVDVDLNGHSLGRLHWGGAGASDILVIPHSLVAAMAGEHEVRLTFSMPGSVAPASVNPESRDQRKLGIALASLLLRPFKPMPFGSWMDLWELHSTAQPNSKLPLAHGRVGELSLKYALALERSSLPAEVSENGHVFLGMRMALNKGEDTPLLIAIDDQELLQFTLVRDSVATRYVAVPVQSLIQGAVLEIAAPNGNIGNVAVLECGAFNSVGGDNLLPVHDGTVINCSAQITSGVNAGMRERLGAWGIDHPRIPSSPSTRSAFISGWSDFEDGGVWSVQTRAYLGLQIAKQPGVPLVVGFRMGCYKPGVIGVRVNSGRTFEWRLEAGTADRFTRYLPLLAADVANGTAIIEFTIDGAVSPAEEEGSDDVRKLGLYLESAAVLDATRMAVGPDTLIDLVSSPTHAPRADGWDQADLTIRRAETIAPMLVSGWGELHAYGVTATGDRATIALHFDPGMMVSATESTWIVLEVLPSKSLELRARLGENAWTSTQLAGRRTNRVVLQLTAEAISSGVQLLDLELVANEGRSAYVVLTALAVLTHDTFTQLSSVWESVGPQPPVIVDLSLPTQLPSIDLAGWHPAEEGGRWMGKAAAEIVLGEHRFANENIKVKVIARTITRPVNEAQSLKLSVNGVPCGTRMVDDSNHIFQELVYTVPEHAIDPAQPLRLTLKCRYAVSPSELGLSEDPRQLGVLVRSVLIIRDDGADIEAMKIPGHELVLKSGEVGADVSDNVSDGDGPSTQDAARDL